MPIFFIIYLHIHKKKSSYLFDNKTYFVYLQGKQSFFYSILPIDKKSFKKNKQKKKKIIFLFYFTYWQEKLNKETKKKKFKQKKEKVITY